MPTPGLPAECPSSLASSVRRGRGPQLSEVEMVAGSGPSWVACLKFLSLNGDTDSQMLKTLTSVVKFLVPMGGGDRMMMVPCPVTGFILADGVRLFLLLVVSKMSVSFFPIYSDHINNFPIIHNLHRLFSTLIRNPFKSMVELVHGSVNSWRRSG